MPMMKTRVVTLSLNALIKSYIGSGPVVNFMSQKLRGIPPGGILLLTLIDSFLHFLGLNVHLLSSFDETITLKLSRIFSQEENRGKCQLELRVKFLLVEFL